MRALIVNGSPRPEKGVHSQMIKSLQKGLIEAGSSVEIHQLYRIDMKPCTGCTSCWKTPGKCIIEDEATPIVQTVAESDLLVIATPVCIDGVTGLTKVFMDRLLTLIKGRVELRDNHVRHVTRSEINCKLALLSACGFPELDNFDPLVAHMQAASRNLGLEYAGEILVPCGWYLRKSKEVWDQVSGLISTAGSDLVKYGRVNPEASKIIGSLAPREEAMEFLNDYYGKIE